MSWGRRLRNPPRPCRKKAKVSREGREGSEGRKGCNDMAFDSCIREKRRKPSRGRVNDPNLNWEGWSPRRPCLKKSEINSHEKYQCEAIKRASHGIRTVQKFGAPQ
jgi:hypothetical protein